jgi:hypothetical protein
MIPSQYKFLRRVRIHDGECGAVARALHHQVKKNSLPAAVEKVSTATQERKVMSNKTFFKRIAISAIAALGFGLLSVVPSQAVVTSSSVSFDADDALTLTGTSSDSVTATLTQTFATTNTAGDSATVYVTITSANATSATLGLRVSDSSTSSTLIAGTASTSPNINFGNTAANAMTFGQAQNLGSYPDWSRNDSRTVALNTSGAASARVSYTVSLHAIQKAGTYTVQANVINYNGGSGQSTSVAASATWTVTVTGRDLTAVAANTTSRIYASTDVGTTDSAVVISSSTLPTTPAANIVVTQKNAANGDAAESMTATLTGPGWLTTAATAGAGTKPTAATGVKTVTVVNGNNIQVWPDGTAGVATITITSFSGTTLGTETVTFHGTRNKIAIDTTNYTIGRAGNGSIGYATGTASATMALTDVAAFVVKVTDSGDRPVSTTVTISSGNTAVVASGSCVENGYAANPGGGKLGFYNCNFTTAPTAKSGDKATLTVRMTDPAVTTTTAYITTTIDVTVGGIISTESAAFDKATYEPGEKMVFTLTGKDASGNPVYDGASPAALTCNKTVGGSLVDQAYGVYVGGKAVAGDDAYEQLFAPGVGGKFKCSGNGGASGLSVITAEASVTDAAMAAADAATDAALEAIDAANAATDAANLAAEAADAATVAAEEARDAADAATAAVEALATEVATLMAALKAQITTLANTVAKIAKKVKA